MHLLPLKGRYLILSMISGEWSGNRIQPSLLCWLTWKKKEEWVKFVRSLCIYVSLIYLIFCLLDQMSLILASTRKKSCCLWTNKSPVTRGIITHWSHCSYIFPPTWRLLWWENCQATSFYCLARLWCSWASYSITSFCS